MTTYILFVLAIISIWVPNLFLMRCCKLSPSLFFLGMAAISGLIFGLLSWSALVALILMGFISWSGSVRQEIKYLKMICIFMAVLMSLMLSLHQWPGFNNQIIFSKMHLSSDAASYSLYINFDKAAVGFFLMLFFCQRIKNWNEIYFLWKPTLFLTMASTGLVLSCAWFFGLIHFEFKFPPFTLIFLIINLLAVCVAEEAFFRGLIQNTLTDFLHNQSKWQWLPIAFSVILFGFAHLNAGFGYAVCAMLSGFFSALAYAKFQRIEISIFMHFILNATHFLFFTYPYIAK
jgi:uncharacterized protein